MNKYEISSFLRKFGLIMVADKFRFCIGILKTYKLRLKFVKENPDIRLPPAYYIYETFNLNYFSFYDKSISTANWLVEILQKHVEFKNISILDWGCGPGRVIRHLPNMISSSCKLYGSDYNEKYVNWCQKNITGITFKTNKITPPLNFENSTFDIVYGISIFTHLSKENHFLWFNELLRVTKPNGLIFLTLHGDAFRIKLSELEQKQFNNGEFVAKANTKEGHRTFAAFQPALFVHSLIGNNILLEHIQGSIVNSVPQQDVWVIRKKE